MQIPQQYPQFEDLKTLVIVSGSHGTKYLTAHQGNIEHIHDFKTENITYSDREGHFLKSAFGRMFGSGSVYEPKKKQERIEFLDEFEKETKKVMKGADYDNIIIMAPDYIGNMILDKIPQNDRKKIFLNIDGNYLNNKTEDILEKIKLKIDKQAPPEVMSEEAKNILEKGN